MAGPATQPQGAAAIPPVRTLESRPFRRRAWAAWEICGAISLSVPALGKLTRPWPRLSS